MAKSQFICERCGCSVHMAIGGWRHYAGRNNRSCGKEPKIICRAEHEREVAAMFDAAMDYANRLKDKG